jgi:hypothetical protein
MQTSQATQATQAKRKQATQHNTTGTKKPPLGGHCFTLNNGAITLISSWQTENLLVAPFVWCAMSG